MEIKGCNYLYEDNDGKIKAGVCEYSFHGSSCCHPDKERIVLTSTLYGAHPANCPLLKQRGEEAKKA